MIVYVITNKINGKQYIGQTIRSIRRRWRDHCVNKKNYPLSNSIRLYGEDNFTINIVCFCSSKVELDEKETEYIKLYNTLSPNGYNLKSGGNTSIYSEEARKNMSDAKRDDFIPWNKGLTKFTDSRVGAQGASGERNSRYGKPSTMLGRKMSEESISKLIKSKTGKPFIKTKKYIDAMRIVYDANKDPIFCEQNGTTYLSIKEASLALDLYSGGISKFFNGALKNVKGYTFKRI